MNRWQIVDELESRLCNAVGFRLAFDSPNTDSHLHKIKAQQDEINEAILTMIRRDEMGDDSPLEEDCQAVLEFWEEDIRAGNYVECGQWAFLRARAWFISAKWPSAESLRFREQTWRVVDALGEQTFCELCEFMGFSAHQRLTFLQDPRLPQTLSLFEAAEVTR